MAFPSDLPPSFVKHDVRASTFVEINANEFFISGKEAAHISKALTLPQS